MLKHRPLLISLNYLNCSNYDAKYDVQCNLVIYERNCQPQYLQEASMENLNNQIKNEDLFVGIDLQKHRWHIIIRTADVKIFSNSIVGRWDNLRRILDRCKGCRIHAVYGAGCFGFWLFDRLNNTDVILISYLSFSFNILKKTWSFSIHYMLYKFISIQAKFKFTMPCLYLSPI